MAENHVWGRLVGVVCARSFAAATVAPLLLVIAMLAASCGGGSESGPNGGTEPVASLKQGLPKGTAGAVNGADDYCTSSANRCAIGEGDCDGNAQCVMGASCTNGTGPKYNLPAAVDVCAPAHCTNGVQDAGETGIDCGESFTAECGICLSACGTGTPGAPNLCVGCLCGNGQGDCDGNYECSPGLVCKRLGLLYNFSQSTDVCVPSHCANGAFDQASGEIDVDCGGECPSCVPNCSGAPGAEPFCQGCRCQSGQGDCDGDSQCQLGLVCQGNVGSKFNLPYLSDACVKSHCTNGLLDSAAGETLVDCGGPCGACGVTDFDLGTRHACDVSAGRVRCWGRNDSGQLGDGTTVQISIPTVVSALTAPHTLVTAGGSHSCALSSVGTLTCWGSNGFGQLGNGSTTPSLTPVPVTGTLSNTAQLASGEGHTCARSNGSVWCWGDNSSGQVGNGAVGGILNTPTQVTGITTAVHVSAGLNHTCVALSDGTVRCWGANDSKKLGDNSPDAASGTPRIVAGVTGATQVSTGNAHSCALAGGAAYCWGNNAANALGIGASNDGHAATVVPGSAPGISIASSASSVCVALSSAGGFVRCWGGGPAGEIGAGSTVAVTTAPALVLVASRTPMVKGGGNFMCSNTTIAPGVLRCWGDDHFGQLGKGTVAFQSTPDVVWPPPNAATAVDAGDLSTCAIAGGQVYCWGQNDTGQLGDGTYLQRRAPTLVNGISNAVSVAVGNLHACAVLSDGSVRCWGSNSTGQLGNGATSTFSITPVTTSNITSAVHVEAGTHTSCALLTNGNISCWGRGAEGELGNGSTAFSATPVSVNLASATALSLGLRHACAIVAGEVRCWGYNLDGQLGAGTGNSSTPLTVPNLPDVISIAAGHHHTCAVRSNGSVYCWGGNADGQLGGDYLSSATPRLVAGITEARSVSAWGSFTCATLATGSTKCWGQNTRGQLGSGFSGANTPVLQSVAGVWTSISAGGRHACGLLTSGQIRCWGFNDYGQVGNGKAWIFPEAATAFPPAERSAPGTECFTDSDCDHGQVCWLKQGPRFDLAQGTNVCVNPECTTAPTPSCGTSSMKCGKCDNVPRSCDGTAGSCHPGEACGVDNNGYFGVPNSVGVCWSAGCSDTAFRTANCGTAESMCGTCEPTSFSQDVVPYFECVETRPHSKVALFSYNNPSTTAVSIPVGANNRFLPTTDNRLQPTVFLPGYHKYAVAVTWVNFQPSWSLNGRTAVVNLGSACPSTFTASGVVDATVKSSAPVDNFGSEPALSVGPGLHTLLQFDRQSAVDSLGTNRLIASARIELTLPPGQTLNGIEAIAMRRGWTEGGATWSCADDTDTSPDISACLASGNWSLQRRDATWDNPWERVDLGATPNLASVSGSIVSIDVTVDLQRLLGPERAGSPLAWVLLPTGSGVTTLRAREAASSTAPRLIVTPVTLTDFDARDPTSPIAPLSFPVGSVTHDVGSMPAFAGGSARPVAATRAPNGLVAEFAENELLVLSDDAALLSAFATRWNATELAASTFAVPGTPKAHLFRVDLSRADPNTLVSSLLARAPAVRGSHVVSSDNAKRLLAIAADEANRGTAVSVNWLTRGAAFDGASMASRLLTDGSPLDASAMSLVSTNNAYDWPAFGPSMHDITGAWARLLAKGKLRRRSIQVGIVDAGFVRESLDATGAWMWVQRDAINPFPCGGGNPCPWHGTDVANTGFGEPGNGRGAAGPGWPVTDLSLLYGFGDMFSIVGNLGALVASGNDIVNYSNAIPIPDWGQALTLGVGTVVLATTEVVTAAARAAGTLVFAAAGNSSTNVDAQQCYTITEPISEGIAGLFGGSAPISVTICPWEETWWFPCENAGVDCVQSTNFANQDKFPSSNYGSSVSYSASGQLLTGANLDQPGLGAGIRAVSGTSFASPLMAGMAALTWAADPSLRAGDVEDCLSHSTPTKFVNVANAVNCAFRNPPNYPPVVQITTPADDATVDSIGIGLPMRAVAVDVEDGPVTFPINWNSSVEGTLGQTASGGTLLYNPSTAGNRVIVAGATDSQGASGGDEVHVSYLPAPPQVVIELPDTRPLKGLPFTVAAKVTNRSPLNFSCPSLTWEDSGDRPLFSGEAGCVRRLGPFAPHVDGLLLGATYTDAGGTGRAEKLVMLDNSFGLGVEIVAPTVTFIDSGIPTAVVFDAREPFRLSASAKEYLLLHNDDPGFKYTWSVSVVGGPIVDPGVGVASQSSFTWTSPFRNEPGDPSHCHEPVEAVISVLVTMANRPETASDSIRVLFFVPCTPL